MEKFLSRTLLVVLACVSFVGVDLYAAEKGVSILEEEQMVEGLGCSLGQEVRRLEVHTHQTGCISKYFKSGKSTQIAISRNGVQICQDANKKVRGNLEAAGYRCK